MQIFRIHFHQIDSTNTWAKRHASQLDPQLLTVVTAGVQTAGRGRYLRRWESSPDENVLASYCFFLQEPRSDIGNIPQLLALAGVEALQQQGFPTQLKWPNDLLLNQKKVGGILCETTSVTHQLLVIVGIGININMKPEELDKIDRPATSLFAESGKTFSVEEVLKELTRAFTSRLDLFLQQGFTPFVTAYRQQMIHTPGDHVTVSDMTSQHRGSFHSISDEGALILETEDASHRTFISGELIE